jgi:hypothetical protein
VANEFALIVVNSTRKHQGFSVALSGVPKEQDRDWRIDGGQCGLVLPFASFSPGLVEWSLVRRKGKA